MRIATGKDIPPVVPSSSPRTLGDAKEVAERLGCSWRHVLRMADAGLMPWGMKIGRLRRWNLGEIDAWIERGCPTVRKPS
jgi:excisionase family DNA binding protein